MGRKLSLGGASKVPPGNPRIIRAVTTICQVSTSIDLEDAFRTAALVKENEEILRPSVHPPPTPLAWSGRSSYLAERPSDLSWRSSDLGRRPSDRWEALRLLGGPQTVGRPSDRWEALRPLGGPQTTDVAWRLSQSHTQLGGPQTWLEGHVF